MSDLKHALAPAELDELGGFLASSERAERAMDICTLEGYFTAIVIGPQAVMPSRWLPWVWDRIDGQGEAIYESLDQANRIIGLLMRFMNGIAHTFMDDPTAFAPIYTRATQHGAAEWCEGFLLGTQLTSDAWNLLWVGKPQLVTPFLRLGSDEGMQTTRKAGDAEHWLAAVEPALIEMHVFWLERRASQPVNRTGDDFRPGQTRNPVTRVTAKVGRNDPCPCASGKKFKKCCGADTGPTLH